MDVNVNKMTQAEKAMLRYRYVLENTAAAQGDYARTADTWHNSLVRLTQSFEQVGSVVGGVLINTFKPFVSALNSVMQSVLTFAKTVANALGAIFGWTIEIDPGGIASDFEAAGAGAEAIEDGTGGAAKNLKDMNKYVAAWNEVNNMTSNDKNGGGGGGGASGVGDALNEAAKAQVVETESIFDKYKSELDDLYKLGAFIGKNLASAMNSIDWESVYQGARNFGTGLAQFLNGLISPELFGATGRTIANSLNTAIYAALAFGEEFDWKKLGVSIATGVNEFFKNFDFKALASTINVWSLGLLNAMISGLEKVEWQTIGTKIGEFLRDIDFMDIAGHIAKAIWTALNGAFRAYKGMLETAPLETALLTLVATVNLLHSDVFSKIYNSLGGINNAIKIVSSGFGVLKTNISNSGLIGGIAESLSALGDKLSSTGKIALTAAAGFAEFFMVKNAIYDLVSGTGSVIANLLEIGVSAGLAAAAMYTALGPAGLAIAAVTGIIAGIVAIGEAWEDKLEQEFEDFQNVIDSNVDSLNAASKELDGLSQVQRDYLDGLDGDIKKLDNLADSYFKLADQETLTKDEHEQLKKYADELIEQCPTLASAIDDVTGKYTAQKDEIKKLIAAQKEQMEADAYKKIMGEYADAITKANVELAVSQKQYETNAKNVDALKSALLDLENSYEDANVWAEKNKETLKEAGLIYEEGSFSASDLAKQISFLEQEQELLSDAIRDGNASVASAQVAYDTANEKMDEHLNKQKELIRSSTEYQQAFLDISGAMDNMNISLSQGFMENLAEESLENGFDMSGLKKYFDSITEGVAASGDSLKRMFADIGLSLPNELATHLATLEADPQAEAVRILMGIESGVQATEPQLVTLFSSLGMELPQELIKALSSQKSSAVQAQTIELLSKIEQGEKLAEGNLIQLFSGLGMTLPEEIITSMGSMNSETQKQTIELLSQISSGYDGSVDELLKKFNDLGLNLPDSLQKALESENEDTRKQVIELFGQIISAEESERGPLIEKLKTLGVDLSEDGLATGIGNGSNSVMTAAKGIIDTAHSSAETRVSELADTFLNLGKSIASGLALGISNGSDEVRKQSERLVSISEKAVRKEGEIHSPSKLFARLGEYVVDGFNKGIEDESNNTSNVISNWVQNLEKSFDFQLPQLDLSIPKPDFEPSSYNLGSFQSTMQMEMDARMAELEFENRQLRETMEQSNQILEKILAQGIVLDDNEFTKRYKSSATNFRRRTGSQLGIAY